MRFWLDKGISGFRVDAVPHLFEVDPKDFGGQYPDEPRSNNNATSEEYTYLNHIYTFQRDEDYDMVFQWRAVLDEYERKDGVPRFMLIESYVEIKKQMDYYGNATHEGAHAPFNFEITNNVNKNSDLRDLKYYIDMWMTYMPEERTANWVVSTFRSINFNTGNKKKDLSAGNYKIGFKPEIRYTHILKYR